MRKRGVVTVLLALALASSVSAEEQSIPEIHKVLVIETLGPASSDAITLQVSLRDESGNEAVQFPSVVGPVYLSVANSQLFSCESNSTVAARQARAFDLEGKAAFTFSHRGFLRSCGLSPDGLLYWLIYSVVREEAPTSLVIVLDANGGVVAEAEFRDRREFEFTAGGKAYSLPVPQAEMPG